MQNNKDLNWQTGKLVLETGEILVGRIPAWQQDTYFGELVFTTGMSGYVESLTDPSFAGQILIFTYPLIGNYGIPNATLFESKKIHARGVVVSTAIEHFSHSQAQQGLVDWLQEQHIPLVCEVDTRKLTKLLRSQGVVNGAILPTNETNPTHFPDPNLEHLVKEVSRKGVEFFSCHPVGVLQDPEINLDPDALLCKCQGDDKRYKIIAVDCGMKNNILRHLKRYPYEIKVVPFDYDFSEEEFDGLFLSNGPGDPERCVETITNLKKVLPLGKPIFGICLGSQILGLAIGAKTYKLPFGHRGQNQPCIEVGNQKAYLTSQNHGYAVDEKTLPKEWKVTFTHLNDGTVAGIAHKTLPYFAVQFHPEASPGPHDSNPLFDEFFEMVKKQSLLPPAGEIDHAQFGGEK